MAPSMPRVNGRVTDRLIIRAARWVDVEAGEVRVTRPSSWWRATASLSVKPGGAARRRHRARPRRPHPPARPDGHGAEPAHRRAGDPDRAAAPLHGVQDDPVYRTLRATVNARTTLLAGFTTVRNLGLMVKTGGYLLDVALARAIDARLGRGPRDHPRRPRHHPDRRAPRPDHVPAASRRASSRSASRRESPTASPRSASAVRYQIKHGAQADQDLRVGWCDVAQRCRRRAAVLRRGAEAIVDEAHRAGIRVAAHAHGDAAIRACIRAGVDCIEHGSLASDDTIRLMVEHGTFLVPTSYLSEGLDISTAAPELQAKAAEVFPKARQMLGKAITAGVKIACGTDAPAIPHGDNAKELWAMVDRGMTPMQALQAATIDERRAHRSQRRPRPARTRLPRRHHRRSR